MFFTTDSMQPAALGARVEERGFELLWVPEHTHIPSSQRSAYPASGGLVRAYYELMESVPGAQYRGRRHDEAQDRHRHCPGDPA